MIICLKDVIETHTSLFDGSNCGIEIINKPIFSVQHHPEASPGPNDSYYLFDKFLKILRNIYECLKERTLKVY